MPVKMENPGFQKSLAYIATLGPVGYLYPAPGTIGSLLAVLVGYVIASFGTSILITATIIVSVIGTAAADAHRQINDKSDAPEVIIDEVAGQWIALIILPLDPWWFAVSFFLFRFFDITKFGPIGMAERISGGIGVVADDIIAGLLTSLCLFGVAVLMGKTALLNFV